MALRNLLVRVGADITGLRQGLKNAQKDIKYFGRNVTGSMKEMRGQIASMAAALGGGLALKSGIQDAMRYEALMATLGESMGSSRKDFEEWSRTVGKSMGFSRLQAADTANLLSLNFKLIADSQEDLVKKTTKMMEVAAVVANKRGMTMQEVSDRIRSAMNQEADGADELGVNVRIAAIQQSKAYQEMANGAPWDALTENMRKTILYHHILEQVSDRLGSTMQDSTAMRMAQFTASLADLKLALGQAFLPIMHTVLPILTKMADALYKAMQFVSAFTRSLFGGFVYKAPKGFADVAKKDAAAVSSIGDAAEATGKKNAKAASKAKEAWKGLFGFDEVNTIKDPEESAANAGGGGGGGGGGIGDLGGAGTLEAPKPDFTAFEETINELVGKMDKYTRPIREKFKEAWTAISEFAKEKFSQISQWWNENSAQITQGLKNAWGIIKPIIGIIIDFIWESVKGLVDGVIRFFEGIIEFFTGVFTGDWKMAWEGLKDMFFGAIQAIWNFFNLSFIGGIKKALFEFVELGVKKLITFSDDFIKWFGKSFDDVVKGFLEFIKKLKQFFKDFGQWMWDTGIDIAHKVIAAFEKIGNVGKTIWNAIKGAFNGVVEWFVRTIINPIVNEFERIKDAFSKGIGEGFKEIINLAIKGFNKALDGFNKIKNKTPFADSIPDLKIPYLARGGITNGPTLAVVGDNVGGREVISPLDRLQGMLTNSVLQAMQIGGGNQAAQTGDIVLNIDGRSFARIVKPFLDREQSRTGSDVRIRTI